MSLYKLANPLVMIPNESHLEEIPDKELESTLINMFKEMKDDTHTVLNKFQQDRNKLLNEFKGI